MNFICLSRTHSRAAGALPHPHGHSCRGAALWDTWFSTCFLLLSTQIAPAALPQSARGFQCLSSSALSWGPFSAWSLPFLLGRSDVPGHSRQVGFSGLVWNASFTWPQMFSWLGRQRGWMTEMNWICWHTEIFHYFLAVKKPRGAYLQSAPLGAFLGTNQAT